MTTASANQTRPSIPQSPAPQADHPLGPVPETGAPAASGEMVRLQPAGTPPPPGWETVTVSADPDSDGRHQPTWEIHLDPALVGRFARGGPMSAEVRDKMLADGWEQVLCDRPQGAPPNSSFWIMPVHLTTLELSRERSRRIHPSTQPAPADIGL